ncbi:hypothetical protein ACEQ8H_008178 [Pleosporales sp. CAS-2024a]
MWKAARDTDLRPPGAAVAFELSLTSADQDGTSNLAAYEYANDAGNPSSNTSNISAQIPILASIKKLRKPVGTSQIAKATIRTIQSEEFFVPRRELARKLTADKIQTVLARDNVQGANPVLIHKHYLEVFAILLCIDKTRHIGSFTRHQKLKDTSLPFINKSEWPEERLEFFDDFKKAQWEFCAQEIHATVELIVVHADYDCNEDTSTTSAVPAHTYVLKSYDAGASDMFYNEKKAHDRLNHPDIADNMVQMHGSWSYRGRHTLLLEYCNGGTLSDLFDQLHPTSHQDRLTLWRNLLDILKPLDRIHTHTDPYDKSKVTEGVHQDITPANILIIKPDRTDRFDYTFKISDMALTTFDRCTSSITKDNRGVQTFSAPECYRNESSTHQEGATRRVRPSKDIWALGCVLSYTLAWSVLGTGKLRMYKQSLDAATARIPGLGDTAYKGCFHDGEKVLKEVREMHVKILRELGASDHIISVMIPIVERMLSPVDDRPNTQTIYKECEAALIRAHDIISTPANEGYDYPLAFCTGAEITTEPSIQQEVPPEFALSPLIISPPSLSLSINNSDPIAAERGSQTSPSRQQTTPIFNHDRTRSNDTMLSNGSSVRPSIHQTMGVGSGPILSRGDTAECPPVAGRLRHDALPNTIQTRNSYPNGNTSVNRHITFCHSTGRALVQTPETTQAAVKLSSTNGTQPVPTSERQYTIQDIASLIERRKRGQRTPTELKTLQLEATDRLKDRHQIFIVDDSLSMSSHWTQAQTVLKVLCWLVKHADRDGIELHFTNSRAHGRSKKCKELVRLFCKPSGQGGMEAILSKILEKHTKRRLSDALFGRHRRSINIYVLTDGVWEGEGETLCGVDDAIGGTIQKKEMTIRHSIGLQFIQFGDNKFGTTRLEQLDHGVKGTNLDIIDHTHAEGDVRKMLLGSFNTHWDQKPSGPRNSPATVRDSDDDSTVHPKDKKDYFHATIFNLDIANVGCKQTLTTLRAGALSSIIKRAKMHRYTAGTPCPAPNPAFQSAYYDLGRPSSAYAPSYATDDTTANIEYTTELKANLRNAKPRRPTRTMRAPAFNPALDIFEDVAQEEEQQAAVDTKRPSRASMVPEGARIKRTTMLAHPAQRIPRPAPPVQEEQPLKPHRARVSHMLAERQGGDVNATLKLHEHVLDQRELRKQAPKKDPRRRTIYVPSDDTTVVTIHPGQSTHAARHPRQASPDIGLDLVTLSEEEGKLVPALKKERKAPRKSLAAPPKRGPLVSTTRSLQSVSFCSDVIGSGGGKENLPPHVEIVERKGAGTIIELNFARAEPEKPAMKPPARVHFNQTRTTTTSQTKIKSAGSTKRSRPQGPHDGSPAKAVKARADATASSRAALKETIKAAKAKASRPSRTPLSSSSPFHTSRSPPTALRRQRAERAAPTVSMMHIVGQKQEKKEKYPVLTEDLARPAMYEDNWLTYQEVAITQLLNSVFDSASSKPTTEQSPEDLRKEMLAIYHEPSMPPLHKRLQASLQYGALGIPKDLLAQTLRLKDDVGLRNKFLNLWTKTYDLNALRAAAETVVGRQISTPCRLSTGSTSSDDGSRMFRAERRAIEKFLDAFLIKNEDAVRVKSGAGSIASIARGEDDFGSQAWSWRRTALRSLMLVLLLDKSKTSEVLPGCLFQTTSPHKTSVEVLHQLSNLLLPSLGDITRPLGHLSYKVEHAQYPLQEYSYHIDNIAVDLRDGIVLARLVELLVYPTSRRVEEEDRTITVSLPTGELLTSDCTDKESWVLSQHLKYPAIGRPQKVYNVQIALSALEGAPGIPRHAFDAIKADDIVDGHRENTLSLLWSLVGKCGFGNLVDWPKIVKETERFREQWYSHRDNFDERHLDSDLDDATTELTGLEYHKRVLLSWSRSIARLHGIRVANLTTSFADTKVLEAIVDTYLPSSIATVMDNGSLGLAAKLRSMGCSTSFISLFAAKDGTARSIPSRDFTLLTLSFLASRLLPLSLTHRAASTIQAAFRRHLLRRRISQRIALMKMAHECAVVAQTRERLVNAATVIQLHWKGILDARRQQMERDILAFQALARGWAIRRWVRRITAGRVGGKAKVRRMRDMAFEVSYSLENEQQFWDELDDIVSTRCQDHEIIDNSLRSFLNVTTEYKSEYLQTDYSVAKCIFCLLEEHQEEDNPTLHIVAAFLLYDGRNSKDDAIFEMMHSETTFPRLVELVQMDAVQEDTRLHQLLLELLYESSRGQRLTAEDFSTSKTATVAPLAPIDTVLTCDCLVAVNDAFILYLLDIIEGASDDAEDPYHYPVIRVLLVMNEQYLVASTTHHSDSGHRITNRVIKALSTHGTTYKTFGCNLILLLNRESETSLQLLILKLLYLLFGNHSTAEYFYTNDLHVLVDVILRNLIDLPHDSAAASALRHTYLRVLHPILMHSQISKPPHYKREELLRLLRLLVNSGTHFAPVDETTQRLVKRCTSVQWLQPAVDESNPNGHRSTTSPVDPIINGQKEVARRALGMSVDGGGESSTSVLEIATHTVQPGVQTPSIGKLVQ